MAKEDRRVEPGFFDKFPAYAQLHRRAVGVVEGLAPTSYSPLDGVNLVGGGNNSIC